MATVELTQQFFPLTDAAGHVPLPKKPHKATIFRWASRGILLANGKRIFLKTVMIGGARCTSDKLLEEFFQALNSTEQTTEVQYERTSDRNRRSQAALQELQAMGIAGSGD